MEIQTKITFKDYWKYYLGELLKKSSIIIFIIAMIYLLYTVIFEIIPNFSADFYSIFIIFIVVFGLFFLPLSIYRRIRKVFFSNKKIQELITYEISEEKVIQKGEDFESEFTWSSLFKVKEIKNWFVLYHSSHGVNLIPKNSMNKDQIQELREIILRNGVKAKLKNDEILN